MVLFNILAAFGAGALAASIGAVNAFIMTGILAIIAGVGTCLGVDSGFTAAFAFGTVMGPHMSFAAGAAATAFAKKKGYIDNGCALGQGLAFLGKADVLVVGGVFGIIAYLIADFVVAKIFGGLIPFGTDNPGMTVVISGIIARLCFTDNGIKSKNPTLLAKGDALVALLVRAIALSLMAGGTGVALDAAGYSLAGWNLILFGLAAVSLLFPGMASWHHIGIISGSATMIGVGAGLGGFGVVVLAVVAGILVALLCNMENCLINTEVDSHIDGEGFSICLMTIVLNVVASIL